MWYPFLVTHFSSVGPASCSLFTLYCSLLTDHSSLLLTSCFLSPVVPLRCLLSFTCVALFAARFLFLPAPFLLLGSCLCWLADRRSLYSAFSSLVAALYSMLGTGRNQLIFASRCSLMAVSSSWLFFADQSVLLPSHFSRLTNAPLLLIKQSVSCFSMYLSVSCLFRVWAQRSSRPHIESFKTRWSCQV